MTTDPTALIRCLTCGFVLGTNKDCGTCLVEARAEASRVAYEDKKKALDNEMTAFRESLEKEH
jgi:DNA-directed RNA polymerase subunit N (RpoN/RPB10)